MMAPRDNLLICVSGRKRVGKSHESLKQLIYHAYLAKFKRKGLIYDINNEYGNYIVDGTVHKIKPLNHNEIIKFSNQADIEVRRIVPIHPNGTIMDEDDAEKLLIRTVKEFRGGILLIDDLNMIFGDAMPQKFTSMLTNNAHRDCDLILQIQSVGRLTPKLRQNINIIRMHAQLDNLDDSKGKLLGDYKILKITQLMIDKAVKNGSPRFFCYVHREDGVIKGLFSPKMLADAIEDFILENPAELGSLTQRRDRQGKKMYTFDEALKVKKFELYTQFNGNATSSKA